MIMMNNQLMMCFSMIMMLGAAMVMPGSGYYAAQAYFSAALSLFMVSS